MASQSGSIPPENIKGLGLKQHLHFINEGINNVSEK